MPTLPCQLALGPALPEVYGTKEYREFRDLLKRIDALLINTGLEHELVSSALEQWLKAKKQETDCDSKQIVSVSFYYHKFKHALRCSIARHLTGESYRAFSVRLQDSVLFQWFLGITDFSQYKARSKSSLDRYEKCFDSELVYTTIKASLASLADEQKARQIGLKKALLFNDQWMDTTCIKAHIHFPVDWVLLRDAARSCIATIKTIRAQGLQHRMTAPSVLLKNMNRLCIRMSHTRRQKESKKKRKVILREMKKLMTCIAKHAQRYHDVLEREWQKTPWSEAQTQCVLQRLKNMLDPLPHVIWQAHERIIGERPIAASKKLFSLYDKNVHIIVRGKSGHEVEFGQGLVLSEQSNGFITDWTLFEEAPPSDDTLVKPMVARLESVYGALSSLTTDRGFSSAKNDMFLESKSIYNATCPKKPGALIETLKEPRFVEYQTRRSQTEARIGIFKNVFLGKPLRSRVHHYKRHAINWCVLTHNLWLLARQLRSDEQSALTSTT